MSFVPLPSYRHLLPFSLSLFLPFIPFSVSVNLKDLGFPHCSVDGSFCFKYKPCWSYTRKTFHTELCVTVWFGFLLLFVLSFFFLLCALRGKHTFRSISRFYLNVVLRVNFLYWSLYWWVHATGNKVLYKRSNQNHCALLRPCLSRAFCPPHRRLSDWTK